MRAARIALGNAAQGIVVNLKSRELRLHPLWLRLSDPGKFTRNRQRLFEISDVVRNPACSRVERWSTEDAGLQVSWADGESSLFSWQWLEACVAQPRLEPHLWGGNFRRFLPEVAYEELASDESKLQFSAYLMMYGIALIRGVPTRPGMVEVVGNEIGHVRATNYGSVFDVLDLGASGNSLAQTNCRIPAHTDNPYRDPFPGVQMLHCLKSAPSGGATVFTDGFAAAAALKEEDPDAFSLLAKTPHPYEYWDPELGVFLRTEAPVLTLDARGSLQRVAFNNRSAAPPLGEFEEVEAYYRAWARFDAICNSPERTVRVQLHPGDLVVFLNSRVMHGREEYAQGGERHLQGAYADHDAVRSRVAAALAAGTDLGRLAAHRAAACTCLEALATQAEFSYGEGVDMLSHALQVAHCAELRGESPVAILACLMHDVGNSPQARQVWEEAGRGTPELLVSSADGSVGYRHHEEIGALYLESLGFSTELATSVRLHVEAKRALVSADPSYMNELSQASRDTLEHQGGPLTAKELQDFYGLPGSGIALRLRRYDDEGKVVGREVPQLDHYRGMIEEHLYQQSLS